MSLKDVYTFLEGSDEGKKLLNDARAEVDKMKDGDARARKAEAEAAKLAASIKELTEFKQIAEAAGFDPAGGVPPPQKNPEKSSAADKEVEILRKQINTFKEDLAKEQKARIATEQRARTDRLRNEFGSTLRDSMGKYGELLADNLISKGLVKLDANGAIIYETGDKIYTKDAAVELLKVEHKDYLKPAPTGSNAPPNKESSVL